MKRKGCCQRLEDGMNVAIEDGENIDNKEA
jgi:hypothetical protein